MPEEPKPIYKFSETFDHITKYTKIKTNDLSELFSCTMDFLKYCGISETQLDELYDLYKEGHI